MIGTIHVCKRCGYEWPSRIDGKPRQCPGCKSPRWDSEARGRQVDVSVGPAGGESAAEPSVENGGQEQPSASGFESRRLRQEGGAPSPDPGKMAALRDLLKAAESGTVRAASPLFEQPAGIQPGEMPLMEAARRAKKAKGVVLEAAKRDRPRSGLRQLADESLVVSVEWVNLRAEEEAGEWTA